MTKSYVKLVVWFKEFLYMRGFEYKVRIIWSFVKDLQLVIQIYKEEKVWSNHSRAKDPQLSFP